MTDISLPTSINKACMKLDDDKKNEQAINRFLKSSVFADAILSHKKNHPDTGIQEYRDALIMLLSHYKAGQPANINDVVDDTHKTLGDHYNGDRTISRNALRDSFIPLLADLGITTGNRPVVWAYLDTPDLRQKILTAGQNWYRARLEKTEAEIALEREVRNQKALRKMEQTVLDNRNLQDDIRHHLDYIKKEDTKCREIAYTLGIPYTKAREETMKKRNKTAATANTKNYLFAALIAGVLLMGFLTNSNSDTTTEHAGTAVEVVETNGLTTGETIWRERYIELFKQHGDATPEMEREMIALSGEYMISMDKMREIVAGISKEEVMK